MTFKKAIKILDDGRSKTYRKITIISKNEIIKINLFISFSFSVYDFFKSVSYNINFYHFVTILRFYFFISNFNWYLLK